MKKSIWTAMTLMSLALTAPAIAGGRSDGGGDEIGLEFQSSFLSAMNEMQSKLPDLYKSIQPERLIQISKQANYIVVDDVLNLLVHDVIQNSIAINNPQDGMIMINRTRWNRIANLHLREGIALHEVLSLAGGEHTGSYNISSAYVAFMGISLADLADSVAVDFSGQTNQECSVFEYNGPYQTKVWNLKPGNPDVTIWPSGEMELVGAKIAGIFSQISVSIEPVGADYRLKFCEISPHLFSNLMYPCDESSVLASSLHGANLRYAKAGGLAYELSCK